MRWCFTYAWALMGTGIVIDTISPKATSSGSRGHDAVRDAQSWPALALGKGRAALYAL